MVNEHPVKFGEHRHCGSGDIVFLMAEEQHSTFSTLNPPLVFICEAHNMSCSHIQNSRA